MSFVLHCPSCREAVSATRDLVGRVMACPHCASHFTIPREGAEAVAVVTPAYNYPPPGAAIRFTFTCQRCGSILEARGDMGGRHGRCPTCGAVFVIPRVDPNTGLATGPAVVAEDGQLPTPMHAYATAGSKAPAIKRLTSGEQVIVCPRCGREMPVDADTCRSCGIPFTMEGASTIALVGSGMNGLATTALTLGILAALLGCLPGFGVVAIGVGLGGLRRAERLGPGRPGWGMSLAGILLGVASLGWIAAYL